MEGSIAMTLLFKASDLPTPEQLYALFGPELISVEMQGETADLIVLPRSDHDYEDIIFQVADRIATVFPDTKIMQ